eukprot:scaffold2879_cov269-Prasinococcus_capsulatus_cf.AAC.21
MPQYFFCTGNQLGEKSVVLLEHVCEDKSEPVPARAAWASELKFARDEDNSQPSQISRSPHEVVRRSSATPMTEEASARAERDVANLRGCEGLIGHICETNWGVVTHRDGRGPRSPTYVSAGAAVAPEWLICELGLEDSICDRSSPLTLHPNPDLSLKCVTGSANADASLARQRSGWPCGSEHLQRYLHLSKSCCAGEMRRRLLGRSGNE